MAQEDLDEYLLLWKALDILYQKGEGDTPGADAIRDASDPLWNRMSVDERRRFDELMEELDR